MILLCRARADAILASQKGRIARTQPSVSRAILTADLPVADEGGAGWTACDLPRFGADAERSGRPASADKANVLARQCVALANYA